MEIMDVVGGKSVMIQSCLLVYKNDTSASDFELS